MKKFTRVAMQFTALSLVALNIATALTFILAIIGGNWGRFITVLIVFIIVQIGFGIAKNVIRNNRF